MKLALICETPEAVSGTNGKMLDTLLRSAGLSRDDCFIFPVFDLALKGEKIDVLFGSKTKGTPGLPPLRTGKYVLPEFAEHLDRLEAQIAQAQVPVVVSLGTTALWAITGFNNLGVRRGGWHADHRLIPTYEPKTILRQYQWFPLAVSDFFKAKGLADGSLSPSLFSLLPRPSLSDVEEFCRDAKSSRSPVVFDIETSPRFRAITCIGLGSGGKFLCCPLADEQSPGFNYFQSTADELRAVSAIRGVLECQGIPKIAHHASYDLTWLWTILGIGVTGPVYDTRIMHHALLPELPHTLASIAHSYFILPPWKALRREAINAKDAQ